MLSLTRLAKQILTPALADESEMNGDLPSNGLRRSNAIRLRVSLIDTNNYKM